MDRVSTTVIARCKSLFVVILWMLPLGYGAYLFVNETQVRARFAAPAELPAVSMQTMQPLHVFNPSAIATVIGLATPDAAIHSAEPLTLRASFVSSTGISRALMAGPDGERTYQEGDSLPGGSILRRVAVSNVALWRNGREELLVLHPPHGVHVLKLDSNQTTRVPARTYRHLKPRADFP